MRHLNKIARQLVAHPSESRLRKAGLILLVAASAAFFVGAPAGAIQITSSSPSGSYWTPVDVVENTNNMVEITTNIDFNRVEWTLGGTLKKRVNRTGTTSSFIPALDGLGRPWGLRRAVTATAYGNDGTSVSRTIWFRVWSASSYINIVKMSGPSDVVVGESLTVDLETDAGFERVDWYIGKADQPSRSTYGPAYKASFTHTFGDGMGSDDENGKPRQIKAKAYALGSPNGDPVKPAEDAFTLNVHEGKGKILRHAFVSVDYFNLEFQYDADGEVESGLADIGFTGGFYYYNDLEGAQAEVYLFVLACQRQRNADGLLMRQESGEDRFKTFKAPNNDGEYWYPEIELAYDTQASGSYELVDARFEASTKKNLPNHYYAYAKVEVHTVAGGSKKILISDHSKWNLTDEDEDGDRVDINETESKGFPNGWFEGFNPP